MSVDRGISLKGLGRSALGLAVGVFASAAFADECISLDTTGVVCGKSAEADGDASVGMPNAAIVVDGKTLIIDGDTASNSYQVSNSGHLVVGGGSILERISSIDSSVNIDSSTVTGGLALNTSSVRVTNSTIQNQNWLGIQLLTRMTDLDKLNQVTVINSSVSGAAYGASVGPSGVLTFSNSTVSGNGYLSSVPGNGGLRMTGGEAHVLDGSYVSGSENGIYIITGQHGDETVINRLEIDGSTVSALTGSAIKIDRISGKPWNTTAKIRVANHSDMHAGNGRLLDIFNDSEVEVEVNNSSLTGDFVADDTSTLNVILRNHGRLDGNIINANSLIIDSSGHWQMGADNSVKTLAMDGGSIGFSGEGFHSLKLGSLSGRGLFDMRINLDSGEGDLLDVAGKAEGRYRLRVQNTGVEAVPESFEALRVVHTEGGNAEFGLVGGRADLGVYSYELQRQGTDWFIVGSGKVISPSTQSALALFNAAPTVWNSELTTLRSRLGEVRGSEEGGGWMRSYGNRFNASLDSGVSYEQKQQGLSFGADAPVPVSDGHLMVGVMGGYSKSDLDIGRGTSGQVDSYYVGAYGTWLSDDGYYVDGVLKLNQFHNESNVAMSDGTKAKGDYSNTALGGSIEVGKHVKLADGYFVEPFVQMSSVWIDGDSYTLDNGLQADTGRTQSVLGKIGSTVGRSFVLEDGGVVQPYVRAALAHEFSRNNEVKVNGQRFDNGLFGSRAELGAGVSVSLSERLQVHADFDYMKGEHVEQPWGANVGLRLAF
nr:autotransporter outer membrane beta-barrel domain-containing protein [Pseudomonas sp. efr-133-TYG-103a]